MTTAMAPLECTTDPAALIAPDLTTRLAQRITVDHPTIDEPTARRIIGQTAAFLVASGRTPGAPLAPSPLVDIGWHTLILHTVDYATVCQRIAGHFVHHVPDVEGEPTENAAVVRRRTLDAITAAGYTVDPDLWPALANCTQCHAGCSDSPNSGK